MLEFYLKSNPDEGDEGREELESLHVALNMIDKGRLQLQMSQFGTTSRYLHCLFVLRDYFKNSASYPSTDIIRNDIEQRINYFKHEDILEVWVVSYALDPISVTEHVTFLRF